MAGQQPGGLELQEDHSQVPTYPWRQIRFYSVGVRSANHRMQESGRETTPHHLAGVASRVLCSEVILKQFQSKSVTILTENTTVVAYLNKVGGTKSQPLVAFTTQN